MSRILITDDDEVLLGLYRALLCNVEGVSVTYARSYEEGHQKLAEGRYDAALFDINLGERGMEGLDLLAEARTVAPEMPTLMMSTMDDATMRSRCAAAARFLSKGAEDFYASLVDAVRAATSRPSAAVIH